MNRPSCVIEELDDDTSALQTEVARLKSLTIAASGVPDDFFAPDE